MVLQHIRKIRNPHVRRATYGILSLHGLFLSLVAIKTAIFHIARLKAVVYSSAALMSLFDLIPHATFAQALPPIDYSISNSTYPIMTSDGQMITYMYYYQNESSPHTPGSNVTISANIPAGMTYHSHEGPTIASQSASQISWNIPSNQSRFGMILLRLMVAPNAYGPLTNTVTVNHANPDPVTSNNSATAIVIANTSAPGSSNVDLEITKTVNRTTATLMDSIIFTINYKNNGTQTAPNVKVYEVLPPSLYIVSRTEPVTPTMTNNLYTRSVGDLAPGEGGQITLRTSILPKVENGHTIINYAVVSSDLPEANIQNNSSEVAILVQDLAPNMDINISGPRTICLNQVGQFTINVLNQGISNAPNVSIRHQKPSTLGWVSSSKSHVTPLPSPGLYVWNYVTTFTPGSNATITMNLRGLSLGLNQAVPVKVLSNGVEYDAHTILVDIVPAEICNPPAPIPGCTNPAANNYNPDANQENGTCTYTNTGTDSTIPGCTNPNAINYNSGATVNDGSCQFLVPGCTNPAASNYDPQATFDNGTCNLPPKQGCTDPTATNYNSGATVNNNTCTYAVITGCLNPAANNHNPLATVSDGYCTFDPKAGCMNPLAKNYDPLAQVSNNSCTFAPVLGCMDPVAINYLPSANQASLNCQYAAPIDPKETVKLGCMNSLAKNYDAEANVNSGCQFASVPGCMNPVAINYNPLATVSNNSCIIPDIGGCIDPAALNYDEQATVQVGTCTYPLQSQPMVVLPRLAAPTTPGGTTVAASPSTTQFFGPGPKKPQTQQTVQAIKKAVQEEKITAINMDLVPTSCDANMVSIYQYAVENGIIEVEDVHVLCEPITRAKLAEIMVNYALKLALVEPNLQRRCTFSDIGGYNNTEKFFIALACDFGFLGVNKDGTVQSTFRPGENVSRAQFAVTAARFLFGDTLKDPAEGQPRYSAAMQALDDAYVMRNINPTQEILLGHALNVMRRIDLGDLIQNTKFIRLREKR